MQSRRLLISKKGGLLFLQLTLNEAQRIPSRSLPSQRKGGNLTTSKSPDGGGLNSRKRFSLLQKRGVPEDRGEGIRGEIHERSDGRVGGGLWWGGIFIGGVPYHPYSPRVERAPSEGRSVFLL